MSTARYASLNLGDHVGDSPQAVGENRRRLKAAAGLAAEPAWLTQVHGTNVVDLDAARTRPVGQADHDAAAAGTVFPAELGASEPVGPADAAFTRRRGRVCAILTADCLPILLAADSGDLVAAAHAGWRGLAGGVIEAAVKALQVAPERLMAWLGPAIGPEHFEVGAEVREALLKGDSEAEAAFVCRRGTVLLASARWGDRPTSHAHLAGALSIGMSTGSSNRPAGAGSLKATASFVALRLPAPAGQVLEMVELPGLGPHVLSIQSAISRISLCVWIS